MPSLISISQKVNSIVDLRNVNFKNLTWDRYMNRCIAKASKNFSFLTRNAPKGVTFSSSAFAQRAVEQALSIGLRSL